MTWFKKHPERIDPDELSRKADASLEKTRKQQPKVNMLSDYLNTRKNQNGFGEDFEFTFKTKEA